MKLFKPTSKDVGNQAETQACRYLQKQGLTLIERNFNCKLGEIDLIMQDGEYVVFIEVRYRSDRGYGSAADSVTRQKQNKLIRTALYYLQNRALNNRASRFDIIAIHPGKKNPDIDWIKNAFLNESF